MPSDVADAPDAGTPEQTGTLAGYHPSSENRAAEDGIPTPSPGSARPPSPPPALPATMEEATAHLSEADRARLPRLLDTVWEHALSELDEWLPDYLVASERERGRIGLAEFFAYSRPECWKDAATQFIERIDMVAAWCERRTAAGKLAFIPLPSRWFDHRNADGFARTRGWYRQQAHQRKQMRIRSEIDRSLKAYWRSLERSGGDVDESLRIIKQRLEKKGGPALFGLFKKKLITAATFNGVA